jgi:hypothetical protein
VIVVVVLALLTVRLLLAELARMSPLPAKFACTPVGLVPGAIVPKLALEVATPLEFVVPLPAAFPFKVNVIVWPLSPTAGDPDVRVADKLTVSP